MNRLRKTSQNSTPTTSNNAIAVRPPLQVKPLSETYKAALRMQSTSSVLPSASTTATLSVPQPRTNTEQYWAARALSAETLLAARIEHHHELRSLSYEEEEKRTRDQLAHDARHAKLERLVLILLGMLALVVLALLSLTHTSHLNSTRKPSSPAHFTIPIFSPFTSVVEHETSVVGSKTLAVFALVLAGLAYLAFRYWIGAARRAS